MTKVRDDVRLAICFPSGEYVSSQFMLAVINFLLHNQTIPIAIIDNVSSSRIAFNRNMLVENAQAAKSTHVLFIDSDMTFPASAIERLLSHDLDIVGATAARRRMGGEEAIGWTLDGERLKVPSPPVKMAILGCPFLLVKIDVFNKLTRPWFAEPPQVMMGNLDNPGLMPEDEYFCHIARKAGYDVYCDVELSTKIGHRGPDTFYIMTPDPHA